MFTDLSLHSCEERVRANFVLSQNLRIHPQSLAGTKRESFKSTAERCPQNYVT